MAYIFYPYIYNTMANFNEHQLNGNRLILLVLGRFFEHIMYRNSVWLRTLPVIFGFLLYIFIFFGMKIYL